MDLLCAVRAVDCGRGTRPVIWPYFSRFFGGVGCLVRRIASVMRIFSRGGGSSSIQKVHGHCRGRALLTSLAFIGAADFGCKHRLMANFIRARFEPSLQQTWLIYFNLF